VYTNNQASCADDGNACSSDLCVAGACTHPDKGTCQCMNASDCDDSNVCTDDSCSPDGKCVNAANTASCMDDLNACTDDVCVDKQCQHVANTQACTDDGSSCTSDVCSAGMCTHQDNKTCECLTPAACDDKNPCTDDSCSGQGKCVHTNNTAPCASDDNQCTCDVCSAGACSHPSAEMCASSTAIVIDSFDSSADWDANVTTPGHLAVTGKNSFDNTNLEGNAQLYLAESASGSLEMAVPNLAGLKDLTVEIQSNQLDTAAMVKVGVFDSAHASWVERTLSSYGTIGQGTYSTLTVPLADFAVAPCAISKVRLAFNVTGGPKEFRLQSVGAK
jgi:hypothetical protein